jgi:transposase
VEEATQHYDKVWALHRQGWSVRAIAAQVGRSCRTIERYLQMPTWPGRQHRRHYGRSILNPYKAYLLERWNAGCHTAIQLFHELQPRGYTGSYRRVTAYVSRIRQAQGIPPRRQGRRQQLPAVAEPTALPLTPRRATWLVLQRETPRTEAETHQLNQLQAQQAEVGEAITLAQDFAQLVRQRQPEALDPWLQRATTSPLETLRRFATGLRDDYAAVKAGVTLPWSNGPVEGHINRLKILKRQMVRHVTHQGITAHRESELEGEFWGHLHHLKPKGRGENSIAEKRLRLKAVWDEVPRDPRHMVKAALLEV